MVHQHIFDCFKRLHWYRSGVRRTCPSGLGSQDRRQFCARMHHGGHPVVGERGKCSFPVCRRRQQIKAIDETIKTF